MNEIISTSPLDGSSVVVRAATEEDADDLLDLIDALADYERLPRPTAEARARLIRDGFGQHRRFRAFLAEFDGRPVGYAITFETYSSFLAQPTLFLEDIFVLPSARGRGAGRAMFRHLARLAVEGGCGRMEWMVLDWNQLAIDFYRKLGAQRLEEWQPFRLTQKQLEDISREV